MGAQGSKERLVVSDQSQRNLSPTKGGRAPFCPQRVLVVAHALSKPRVHLRTNHGGQLTWHESG